MADTLIITFIARDRPGVVEHLSAVVAENGGNWLESRMAHLAETFAGVANVTVPAAGADALKRALEALAEDGFQIMVHDAEAPPASAPSPAIAFAIVGPDHPGIVHELTRTIAGLGASVEEMETRIESAPMGGGTLFHAETRVRLPDGLGEDEFREALEHSAEAIVVDVVIGEDG